MLGASVAAARSGPSFATTGHRAPRPRESLNREVLVIWPRRKT